jgi:ABC-2 type transport system permease protein
VSYLRLLITYFRLGVMGEAAYRANFFFQLFQSVLSLLVAAAGVAVVFSYTSSIGGWGPDEILVLVGIYILVGGIIGLVIQPSMERFIESVRDGTLDFVLTKPDDAQVLVSIQQINIWSLVDLLLGIAVLAVTFVRLGEKVGIAPAGEFILLLLTGAVIIYSFFLILATLSFWFVRVENILTIFQSMYEAGRWPVSLYPGWLRYGLTFVIPIAFATTVPAEALTGRLNWETSVGAITIAIVLFFASRLFWRIGLRRYSGSSA